MWWKRVFASLSFSLSHADWFCIMMWSAKRAVLIGYLFDFLRFSSIMLSSNSTATVRDCLELFITLRISNIVCGPSLLGDVSSSCLQSNQRLVTFGMFSALSCSNNVFMKLYRNPSSLSWTVRYILALRNCLCRFKDPRFSLHTLGDLASSCGLQNKQPWLVTFGVFRVLSIAL